MGRTLARVLSPASYRSPSTDRSVPLVSPEYHQVWPKETKTKMLIFIYVNLFSDTGSV